MTKTNVKSSTRGIKSGCIVNSKNSLLSFNERNISVGEKVFMDDNPDGIVVEQYFDTVVVKHSDGDKCEYSKREVKTEKELYYELNYQYKNIKKNIKLNTSKVDNKIFYEVFDTDSSSNKKLSTQTEMINYAKKRLKFNKTIGFDKELLVSDLNEPINAWVYLKNIGIGNKTNRKSW